MSECPLTKNMLKYLELVSGQAWWPLKGKDEPIGIECLNAPQSSAANDLLVISAREKVARIIVRKQAQKDPNYSALFSVLKDALDQAANGKGKERHANNDPFEQQSICEISRKHGVAFATGQAAKKLEESHRLLQLRGVDVATSEILGAINYAAAAIIVLREAEQK